MFYFKIVIVFFAFVASVDYLIGCKFKIGKEFEKGFMLLGVMALSVIGMIVVTPVIADVLAPFFNFISEYTIFDPSIVSASFLANDMGGASLSLAVAENEQIGKFNAFVVSSMMGCTISFTLPFALGLVKSERRKELCLGILCGVITIPVGCFVSGIIAKIPFIALCINLLPLFVLSAIIAIGVLFAPNACLKIFVIIGFILKTVIVFGLAIGLVQFILGVKLFENMATFEEGAMICVNAAATLAGMLPIIYIFSKILKNPLKALVTRLHIFTHLLAFPTLLQIATTFGIMNDMDKKGTVIIVHLLYQQLLFWFISHIQ